MRSTIKSSAAWALCAAMAVTALPSETLAGPTGVSNSAVVSLSSPVETVHYYRHYRYWRHRHHHYGYGYGPYYGYGYNPAGAILGAAAGLATAPLWGGWGYPYYGYRRYGWW
ncbi:MAG: hypothetical protein HYS06_10075 [Methylocystis sp.]|nr:hypothetical protein [Methylocystis sp.]